MTDYATEEGTKRYFEKILKRYPQYQNTTLFRKIPHLDFFPSLIGFGTYRVHYQKREHFESIREAILGGVNVIDTASNFSDGGAEVLIGNVLNELLQAKRIQRDEVVIISKAGYHQGKQIKLFSEKKFRDMFLLGDRLYYCIHPDFLELQIQLSLKRLKLRTLDVFLLNNPELLLKVHEDEKVVLKKIESAFDFLEKLRSQKLIRYYGISSNGLVYPRNHPEFLDFTKIMKIAKEGFKVLQFPANLLETGFQSSYLPYQGKSLIDLANEKNLWVISQRPFNAIFKEKVFRFATLPQRNFEQDKEPETYLSFLEEQILYLEDLIRKELSSKYFEYRDELSPYEVLKFYRDRIEDPEVVFEFIKEISHYIRKSVSQLRFFLEIHKLQNSEIKIIFDMYIKYLNAYLGYLPKYVLYKNHLKMEKIERTLAKLHPVLSQMPLSLQVVYLLLNFGISTVLIGMRKVSYVQQMLEVFTFPLTDKKILDAKSKK
ncbi:MAG: aldo/keto reductase [Leptospiraceae bacterium]|nr:aldo/keto reductase [Leptospiraceae bacterium]MDW7977062.1 aldo/keto reductase [Leptospiraceae bacterium]